MTITVICQHGMARFEMHRHRWLSAQEPGEELREESHWDLQPDDLFVRQADRFLNALHGRAAPACTLAEAIQTQKAILAVLKAARTKAWQTIEPVWFRNPRNLWR